MSFFKKKFDVGSEGFSNLIGPGTEINGDINFSGVIHVAGKIAGNLLRNKSSDNSKDGIVVLGTGEVTSKEVMAFGVIIHGVVNCEKLWVEDSLTISSTAKISNAVIYYRNISVEDGAVLHNCVLKHLDQTSEAEEV